MGKPGGTKGENVMWHAASYKLLKHRLYFLYVLDSDQNMYLSFNKTLLFGALIFWSVFTSFVLNLLWFVNKYQFVSIRDICGNK